jgi:hypothetical protein
VRPIPKSQIGTSRSGEPSPGRQPANNKKKKKKKKDLSTPAIKSYNNMA